MNKAKQGSLAGIIPPPIVVLALSLVGSALTWRYPLRYQEGLCRECWLVAGSSLIAISGSLALFARQSMLAQRTPIGFDKPTAAIIANGPFRFTRNPLYLSLLMLFAGIGVAANSAWFALLIVALGIFLHKVVLREEAYLERAFGAAYLLYKETVRRWI